MRETTLTPRATLRHRIGQSYREALPPLIRHPATWLYLALFALAAGVLFVRGRGEYVIRDSIDVGRMLALVAITIPLTMGGPRPNSLLRARVSRRRLWAQIAGLGIWLLLILHYTLTFHGVAPSWLRDLPLWSGFLQALAQGEHTLGIPSGFLVNPLLYFILPGAFLLAMGARPTELGLGRGYRIILTTLLWSFIPLTMLAGAFISGKAALGALGFAFLANTLRNGFMEEFLFRGALLTRLAQALDVYWGVVLASLAFGLLHLGLDTQGFGGDYLAGLAATVVNQSVFGLAMGFVFLRTRNLAAPAIIHAIGDI